MIRRPPPPNPYAFESNLGLCQGIDFAQDFLQAFGADVREACRHVPPVFHNKKSAEVIPITRRSAAPSPSVPSHEVPSCLPATCLKPSSDR